MHLVSLLICLLCSPAKADTLECSERERSFPPNPRVLAPGTLKPIPTDKECRAGTHPSPASSFKWQSGLKDNDTHELDAESHRKEAESRVSDGESHEPDAESPGPDTENPGPEIITDQLCESWAESESQTDAENNEPDTES